ncbi:MAG: hypothetical protein IPK44_18740 [Candidatus Accumulibacter sp.]|uniref:hypothetical protein n=1 Tax=Accumulibacter sp. TaxID=2053492 RepID=UPI002590B8DE|nr:hypothetical protein [Accumulibacter sp.]MBK8116382.1 hypothetical protein [Accumulibacter sp.]
MADGVRRAVTCAVLCGLAERTALSTREIATTVQSIVDETAHAVARIQTLRTPWMTGSVELAREAGQALAEIDVSRPAGGSDRPEHRQRVPISRAAPARITRLVERIARMADGGSGRATQNSERAGRLQRLAAALRAQLARFTTEAGVITVFADRIAGRAMAPCPAKSWGVAWFRAVRSSSWRCSKPFGDDGRRVMTILKGRDVRP